MIVTLLVCLVVYVWYTWGDCLKRIPPYVRILAGFFLGAVVGLSLYRFASPATVRKVVTYVAPFGELLLSMLKLAVYPILLFPIIHGAAALSNRRMRQVGRAALPLFLGGSSLAAALGVLLAVVLRPAIPNAAAVAAPLLRTAETLSRSATAPHAFGDFLVNIFQNPFAALANGRFLAVVFFAIAFGVLARKALDAAHPASRTARSLETVLSFADGARHISFRLMVYALHYFPIGIFALTAVNFAQSGFLIVGPYAKVLLCVVAGILTMMFAVYPVLIFLTCRENPYAVLRKFREPILTAFAMRSSIATLPVCLRAADTAAIDRSIAGAVLPIGATLNMNGVCLHLPAFVVLAAALFGHPLAGFDLFLVGVSVVLASLAAGGIPGGSVILLFPILRNMGLGDGQIAVVVALCLAVNPILDMFETACNVTGDLVSAYIVSRRSGFTLARQVEAAKGRILADGKIDFDEAEHLLAIVRPYARLGDIHAVKLVKLLDDACADGKIDSTESELLAGLLDLLSERFADLKTGRRA